MASYDVPEVASNSFEPSKPLLTMSTVSAVLAPVWIENDLSSVLSPAIVALTLNTVLPLNLVLFRTSEIWALRLPTSDCIASRSVC